MLKSQVVAIFKRIYSALPHPLRRSFWNVTLLAILTALTEFVLAGLVSLLGVALASPQSIVQAASMQTIVQRIPVLQPVLTDTRLLLALLLGGLCVIVLVKNLLQAFLSWRQSRFSQAVGREFGIRLFTGYLHTPLLWHTLQKVSHLSTVLAWRTTLGAFLFNALQVLSQAFVTGILIITVCLMAPLASVMILSMTSLCAWAVFRFSRFWVHELSRRSAVAQQDAARVTYTGLTGIREVMIYRQQETFIEKFADAEKRNCRVLEFLPLFAPLPAWVLEWLGMVLLLGTTLLLYVQNAALAHISATLALLAAVAWRLLPVMNRVIQSLIGMQQQLPMLEPVLNLLQEVNTLAISVKCNSQPYPFQNSLHLRQVCFRYPGEANQDKEALHNLEMCIRKGSMTGIIGSSGSGKSTIVGILAGLYLPTQGEFLIDGRPLQHEQTSSWMQGIGYVPQSPFLLNGTILENVAFSQWGQHIDRERVLRCCRMAAMNFLEDLPNGVDTEIGERGVRLSGGQIQRVAIARALYGAPQILLFDEATSALDGASEEAIQHTINSLSGQVTMIVVAHRLTTVEKCDFLYWIEEGTLKMEGRPEVVLPTYAQYLKQHAAQLVHNQTQ